MSEAGYIEPILIDFAGGPLAGSQRRMVVDDDVLYAWAHRQAKGVVQVTDSDGTRQDDLWECHPYLRTREGEGWASYRYSPEWLDQEGKG